MSRARCYRRRQSTDEHSFERTSVVRAQLKGELASYEGSKGTVRFPLSEPVATRIVGKLARLAESRARAKAGRAGPKNRGWRRMSVARGDMIAVSRAKSRF